MYEYGYWTLVIRNVLLMLLIIFAIFKPKTKTDWKSMGAISAFFVALFTEMYGFPFTIYMLTTWLGKRYPVIDPFSHNNGHILKVIFGDSKFVSLLIHPGSDIILIIAFLIISIGWRQIHQGKGKGELVKDGIYRYIRHPQYTGFYLIIFSFLLQWPTITTLIMVPFLIWLYNHLAKKEEKNMVKEFGDEYVNYIKSTRRFLPSVKHWKEIITRRKIIAN